MRVVHLSACLLAALLAISAGIARAAAPDLSEALPGKLAVGALIDLSRFLQTFPELSEGGFIGEQLDELVARGVPDPRQNLGHLALGSRLGKPDGVPEGVALGTGSLRVVPVIRKLAADNGIPLQDSAYHGVTFVTGTYNQRTSRFGDLVEDVMVMGFDAAKAYGATHQCVDALANQAPSFRDEYGHGLDPETFLTGRMRLTDADRNAVKGTRLEQLQHIVDGQADVWGDSTRVKMEIRARATSSLKAMVALSALRSKLEKLAADSGDPAVKRLLLEQTRTERRGATLMIDTDAPRDDFVAGILALEELLRN